MLLAVLLALLSSSSLRLKCGKLFKIVSCSYTDDINYVSFCCLFIYFFLSVKLLRMINFNTNVIKALSVDVSFKGVCASRVNSTVNKKGQRAGADPLKRNGV